MRYPNWTDTKIQTVRETLKEQREKLKRRARMEEVKKQESFQDYLAGQNTAAQAWSLPLGVKPRPRFRIAATVKNVVRFFDFFTYAASVAYNQNELGGRGEIVAL